MTTRDSSTRERTVSTFRRTDRSGRKTTTVVSRRFGAFIQQRIRHGYRRQRPTPLPSRRGRLTEPHMPLREATLGRSRLAMSPSSRCSVPTQACRGLRASS
jgi:hypothetical protein